MIAPAKLQQILRGELDWVVMKALDKNRHRRYQSASDFADDISRYLESEPVTARPPSSSYRLRKFISKNRGLVAGVIALIVVLLLGFSGTTAGMIWAWNEKEIANRKTIEITKQKNIIDDKEKQLRDEAGKLSSANEKLNKALNEAEEERKNAEKVVNLVYEVFDQPSDSKDGSPVTGIDLFKRVENTIIEQFEEQPEVQDKLLSVISKSYQSMGVSNSELLSRVYELKKRLFGETAIETLDSKAKFGDALRTERKVPQALEILKEAVSQLTEKHGLKNKTTLWARHSLAWAYSYDAQPQVAFDLELETFELWCKNFGSSTRESIASQIRVAQLSADNGDFKGSLERYKDALQSLLQITNESDYQVLHAKASIAYTLMRLQRYDEAIRGFEELLDLRTRYQGKYGKDTLESIRALAEAHLIRSKGQDLSISLELIKDCIGRYEDKWNGISNQSWLAYRLFSDVYYNTGKVAEAIDVCERLFEFQLFNNRVPEYTFVRDNYERVKTWRPNQRLACKGLSFDGVDDAVVIPSLFFDGTPPITWEAILLPERSGEAVQYLLSCNEIGGATLGLKNGVPYFSIFASRVADIGEYRHAFSEKEIDLGRSIHIASTWMGK